MLFQYYILWPIAERGGAQPSSLRLRLRLGTPGKPFEWRANVILKRLTRLHRGDAEVAEAESWRMFSGSNPQTSRSAISAPPRGSSSNRRRCNLEKTLQITSRRGGEAEVAEAESWRMFSGSNPKTSRSAISASPRGFSSSRRRCNLEKTLQITSRRRGEAEVAEAESWRMFSGSNPQTCRSAISAPPRGSSSSSRRCNLL